MPTRLLRPTEEEDPPSPRPGGGFDRPLSSSPPTDRVLSTNHRQTRPLGGGGGSGPPRGGGVVVLEIGADPPTPSSTSWLDGELSAHLVTSLDGQEGSHSIVRFQTAARSATVKGPRRLQFRLLRGQESPGLFFFLWESCRLSWRRLPFVFWWRVQHGSPHHHVNGLGDLICCILAWRLGFFVMISIKTGNELLGSLCRRTAGRFLDDQVLFGAAAIPRIRTQGAGARSRPSRHGRRGGGRYCRRGAGR